MKYTFDFLHREIMKYRSLNYEQYKSSTEVDLLQYLLKCEDITDYYEVEWDAFIDDLIGELPAPTKWQLARDWTLEFAPKTKLEAFVSGIISRDERVRLLTFFRDHHREVFYCNPKAVYAVNDEQIEKIFSFFEDDCARLISKNLQESVRDSVHGEFLLYPRPNLKKIAMGDAPKPQFTAEEKKIIASIPSYPGDRQLVSREQIFLEAKEQVRLFVDKAERYDRDKQEADKPCMSQRSYIDPIEQNLHRRANRYLYFDKNPAYQVLFVMYILMRLPSRKHTWWEEKFAESIPTYLDTTQYFNGYKAKLDATIAKVVAVTQPTLDFGSAPLTQEPKTEEKKNSLSIPHAETLTININGSVDKIETTAQNVVIPQSSSLIPQEVTPASSAKFQYIKSENPVEIKEIEDTTAIYVCGNKPSELCKYLFQNEGSLFKKMPVKADVVYGCIMDRWGDENQISSKGLRAAWSRHQPAGL